ncbi:MAG: hypothetical protein AB1657_04210 [Candidatus Micrarchaeota archaeon]
MFELLGYALQLAGVFLAFLAAGLAFIIADMTKGGATARSTRMIAFGLMVLALGIFLTYAGTLTGAIDPLSPTPWWPLLGAVTALGFALLLSGLWTMLKALRGA